MCPCKIAEQTTDHILYDCELVKQERDKLKAEILRSENWPVSKNTVINKYTKSFKKICGQHTSWKITEYKITCRRVTNLCIQYVSK